MISRRSLLGFIAAAPVIVKAASLMPIKALAFEPAEVWGIDTAWGFMPLDYPAALRQSWMRTKWVVAARVIDPEFDRICAALE